MTIIRTSTAITCERIFSCNLLTRVVDRIVRVDDGISCRGERGRGEKKVE